MNGNNQKQVTITIFGGTGDLTFRKLLPALYNLQESKQATMSFNIISIGRRPYTNEEYHQHIQPWIEKFSRYPFSETSFKTFTSHIQYYQMDFTNLDNYQGLNTFYQQHQVNHHLFYFAVAPRFFKVIADGLHQVEFANQGKVIIEKPFGEDLPSACVLNQALEGFFGSNQVFHIDHYLGKEMVRNIQAIRFMNPIFKNVWNHDFIESIMINSAELNGVDSRGGYYDHSGALKDMVQNHLFQILSIVAMEEPTVFYGKEMHEKQLDVLKALRVIDQQDIEHTMVLGQYASYQREDQVAKDSNTETYAALKLFIDNQRWQDVPFMIQTGKKLDKKEMSVTIIFKNNDDSLEKNQLKIAIQPLEGVSLKFNMKKPGGDEIASTMMDFCQNCNEENRINTPEAYERLLIAAINNDTFWFSKWDQIQASWEYVNQLREAYYQTGQKVYRYEEATLGPIERHKIFPK